jgi:hypothetical protein
MRTQIHVAGLHGEGRPKQGTGESRHGGIICANSPHIFHFCSPRPVSTRGQQGLCRHAVSRTTRLGASITTFQPASATTLHTVWGPRDKPRRHQGSRITTPARVIITRTAESNSAMGAGEIDIPSECRLLVAYLQHRDPCPRQARAASTSSALSVGSAAGPVHGGMWGGAVDYSLVSGAAQSQTRHRARRRLCSI